MSLIDITYQQYGINGVLLSWPQKVDSDILKDIILIKELLLRYEENELQDITNGYCTLLLIYNDSFQFPLKEKHLKNVISISRKHNRKVLKTKLWTIPVCYHESFGIDLESFSKSKKMDKQEVINIHTASDYQVYCKGFLPGFMYLGGLNPKLHMPRKSEPILRVPKNSVAIGGEQTGVYPCESPGGWRIIGRTPIVLFDIYKKTFSEIKIGDTIKFQEISLADYLVLESENENLRDYEG